MAAADPPKDKAAATVPKNEFTRLPQNEKEYFAFASEWIYALDDPEFGEQRWKDEKNLRNKANVGAESREELAERLKQKQREIANADLD
jgi:hypothetical protein